MTMAILGADIAVNSMSLNGGRKRREGVTPEQKLVKLELRRMVESGNYITKMVFRLLQVQPTGKKLNVEPITLKK
jgi:hypothetical protein